jgi:CRP-like cAMP-binding protein
MNTNFAMTRIPDWLEASSRTVNYKQGQFLYHQNKELDWIYVVQRGSVSILYDNAKGQEVMVVLVPEGGTVGEMEAMVGVGGVMYSAKAHTDCELIALPVREFLRWVETDLDACKQLSRLLALKLYAASSQSAHYLSFDAMDRLIAALCASVPGVVRYTRLELAETCSVSVRTINRCVKKLASGGEISLQRGKIVISLSQHNALRLRLKQENEEDHP